jgi:Tfp pilus assembly protein FimV
MVAIHLPQEEPADWPLALRPGAGSIERAPARPVRRAAPDRATRYRRRRLAALVLATVVVVGSAGAVGYIRSLVALDGGPVPIDAGPTRSDPAEPRLADGEAYVVQPGDTYWSIAAAIAPDDDPRPVVDRLREASGGKVLQAGDRLVIDAG